MNKRSFTTRKVYARKPASTKTGKKSVIDTGAIKKGSKTILIWGLLVINVILVASLVKKIIIPSGGTGTSIVDSSTTSVSVLNGCGVKGVALVFADALREKQYNVVNTGNAETFDYEKSVLINRGQISNREVEKIAALVGVSRDRILTIESKTSQSDVDLIIGSDYKDLRAYKKKH
ncbi:MAG TPA: LytR C-terminal domain-containing protein [bacterium]|nr:LytR C-terminal domain-containing protein [bacterium]HOC24448.1 LytR C-terminal domain-containing protein [bacterium]HOH07263.1 LytR C-terminal domain-containing protein [bacterium]HOY44986.1 LytR C-terminal domain-containing protein [bacterium]HPG83320.1 LytR C-terminal domain-containing protein [bacterium]